MFSLKLSQEEKTKRQNIFVFLPQDLKSAIVSEETADKLYNISWGKFKLEKEKQRIVSFTIGEAMIGIVKLEEFSKTLKERLEIDQITAEKIAQEIKQQIFQPVMASLMKAQQEIPKQTPQKPPIPATPQPTPNIVDLKNLPKQ